jgi:hypothetical protein
MLLTPHSAKIFPDAGGVNTSPPTELTNDTEIPSSSSPRGDNDNKGGEKDDGGKPAGKAFRQRGSAKMSFVSQASGNGSAANSVETLINFLTTNIDNNNIKDRTYLRKFEELTAEVLSIAHDAELQRIIKSHGWTGSRYRNSEDTPLEASSLLQALSNLYLRNKVNSYTNRISNLFGLGDEKGADDIFSFCPDLLLTAIKENAQGNKAARDRENNGFSNGVNANASSNSLTSVVSTGSAANRSAILSEQLNSYSFTGACMLADISGFSKFSGAMCSKGVSGLDELREATNGFLGHIVKIVYEYHGDGK